MSDLFERMARELLRSGRVRPGRWQGVVLSIVPLRGDNAGRWEARFSSLGPGEDEGEASYRGLMNRAFDFVPSHPGDGPGEAWAVALGEAVALLVSAGWEVVQMMRVSGVCVLRRWVEEGEE